MQIDNMLKACGAKVFMKEHDANNRPSGEVVYEKLCTERIEIEAVGEYVIIYLTTGAAILNVSGKRYDIDAGDSVICPVGSKRTLEAAEQAIDIEVIHLRPHLLPEAVKAVLREKGSIISTSGTDIRGYIDALTDELKIFGRLQDDAVRARLTMLAIALARIEGPHRDQLPISSPVACAVDYISKHISERLSLGEVAAIAKVSTGHLSRRFKAEIGVGFADYVASARLDRAETMLRERPEMSITEIAFSSGFNDSNYFSDKFKKRFGVSPLKYKKH